MNDSSPLLSKAYFRTHHFVKRNPKLRLLTSKPADDQLAKSTGTSFSSFFFNLMEGGQIHFEYVCACVRACVMREHWLFVCLGECEKCHQSSSLFLVQCLIVAVACVQPHGAELVHYTSNLSTANSRDLGVKVDVGCCRMETQQSTSRLSRFSLAMSTYLCASWHFDRSWRGTFENISVSC